MLNSDDKQFESYLKSFRPAALISLPENRRRVHTLTAPQVLWGSITVSMIMLIIGDTVWHARTLSQGADRRILERALVSSKPPSPPLTIGSVNQWLSASSSVDAALDDLAFRAKDTPVPADRKSAIAVLGEENTLQ